MGLSLYIHTLQLIKKMKQIVEHLSLEIKRLQYKSIEYCITYK